MPVQWLSEMQIPNIFLHIVHSNCMDTDGIILRTSLCEIDRILNELGSANLYLEAKEQVVPDFCAAVCLILNHKNIAIAGHTKILP